MTQCQRARLPRKATSQQNTVQQDHPQRRVTLFHLLFRLSDFSQPVSFDHAEIGRCPNLAPPPPPAPLPDEEELGKEGEELKPSQAPTPAAVRPPPAVSVTEYYPYCFSHEVDLTGKEQSVKDLLVPSCGRWKIKNCAVRKGHVLPCLLAWPVPVSASMQTNGSKMTLSMPTTAK